VESLKSNALSNCTNLISINVESGNKNYTSVDGILYDMQVTQLLICPAGKTSVTIPSSVTIIGLGSFFNCTGLTAITIPNSVTKIGRSAFEKCTGLKTVEIPNSVAEIEMSAFKGCAGLTKFTIPTSVTIIRKETFDGCSGLMTVTIPASVTEIGQSAFSGCSGLTTVTIPASVTEIGQSAFSGCSGLTTVTIPVSVTEIGYCAFSGCSGLTAITIPNAVVDHSVFKDCSNLVSVDFGNSIISNSRKDTFWPFMGCSKLKKIVIRNPEANIPKEFYALSKDPNDNRYYVSIPLEEIVLPYSNRVHCFGEFAGTTEDYSGTYSTGSNSQKYDGTTYYFPGTLKKITYVGDPQQRYTFRPGMIVNNIDPIEYKNVIFNAVESGPAGNSLTFHYDGKESLPAKFFESSPNLKSLTLPFSGTGSLENYSNFGELFSTSEKPGTRAVTQFIEGGTQKTYYLPISLENLTISEGCSVIPYGNLSNCNMLKTLTLPVSVFMVSEKALYGCAGLSDIYCHGAEPAVAYDNSFDGMRFSSCKLHVPYNSGDLYKNAEGWKRFYFIQEEAPIQIKAVKNIENAGVIFGLTEYEVGQTAELRAVANSGYTFDGWFENGEQLTSEGTYSFLVTESRNLTAAFSPVSDDNPVEVTATDRNITLSWPAVEGATGYTATAFTDEYRQNSVESITVDASSDKAPAGRASADQLTATFNKLSSETNYYYRITANGKDGITLSVYDGTFTTGQLGIETVSGGQVEIKVKYYYNLQGVKSDTPWRGLNIIVYSDGSIVKAVME